MYIANNRTVDALRLASELGRSLAGDIGAKAFVELELAFATRILPKFTDDPITRVNQNTLLYWQYGYYKSTILKVFSQAIPEISKVVDITSMTLEKILESMFESYYIRQYFGPKLEAYTSSPRIREVIVKGLFLDKIITLFTKSNSFGEAKQNSAALLNFNEDLTGEQIKTITMASLENDQISESWGAQSNLKKIFSEHREEISEENKAKIEKALHINF
jgi:hypothetical protein